MLLELLIGARHCGGNISTSCHIIKPSNFNLSIHKLNIINQTV